jgi:hypothetical protein
MYSIPSAMPIWVRRCVFLSSSYVVLARPFFFLGLFLFFLGQLFFSWFNPLPFGFGFFFQVWFFPSLV